MKSSSFPLNTNIGFVTKTVKNFGDTFDFVLFFINESNSTSNLIDQFTTNIKENNFDTDIIMNYIKL